MSQKLTWFLQHVYSGFVVQVDRWPETGYVKKLQRRDNTFYYYNKQRECDDKEVHKVKIYAY